MTIALQRKLSTSEAAKLASSILELDDLRRLTIALAEAAAQELVGNRPFAARVRALYDEVPATPSRASAPDPFATQLVPIKMVPGRDINPAAPLDPYFLLEVYGASQLETALNLFPVAKLKEGAAMVERHHPGTKPTNRGRKAALVEYIVRYASVSE